MKNKDRRETMVLPIGHDGSKPEVSHKRKRRRRGQQDESDKQLSSSSSSSINDTAIKTMEADHDAHTIATNTTTGNNTTNINSNSSHKESTSPSKKRRRGNQTKAPPLIANGPSSQEKLPQQSSSTSCRPPDHPRRKIPLSPAVLEFSTHLKELVRQKNLHSLLKCYYSKTFDDIRDEHHACIVIDACAKGGGTDHDTTTGENNRYTSNSIDTAEQIVSHLQQQVSSSSGVTPHHSHHQKTLSSFNVETLTALLKVYVHAGNLPKGWELFRTHIIHPNVRTLNTLLRGCLWSAVTMFDTDETSSILQLSSTTTSSNTKPVNHPLLCGGVVTSENAWQHYLANYKPSHHSSVSTNKINSSSTDVDTIRRQQQQQGLDTSSYEYSIQLLCQSLQVDIATKRMDEYCTIHGIRFKGTAKIIQNHCSSSTKDIKNSLTTSSATTFETLAVMYLALSRAYAVLIVLLRPMEYDTSQYSTLLWLSCQRCLSAIRLSRSMLLNQNSTDTTLQDGEDGASTKTKLASKKEATTISAAGSGGKRSWKSGQQHQQSNQRELSNVAYRTHRLSEIEMDVLSLLKHSSKNKIQAKSETSSNREQSALSSNEQLCFVAQQIQQKLLYFSGGAMTSASTSREDRTKVQNRQSRKQLQKQKIPSATVNLNTTTVRQQLLLASWYSFGLSHIYATITKNGDTKLDDDASTRDESNSVDLDFNRYTAMESAATHDCNSVIRDDGMINTEAVFTSTDRPLDIEIGAGFGTWIVDQAKRHMDRNFIAMELRADRCYQIYTRAMLHHSEPLPNLCVVGCDCNILLRERIARSTVSTFYAHHPEPPTQVSGDNFKFLQQLSAASSTNVVEPIHMLHSSTLLYMCQCLKNGGYIVIVSDSRSYIRLIAATFTKVARQNTNTLRTVSLEEVKKGSIHSFDETVLQSLRPFETFQSVVEIYVYENKVRTSNQKNGNVGTSYFDRLWRTGAGTHSETHTRFVIVMQKTAK